MELWSDIFIYDSGDWATCTASLETWHRIIDDNPGCRLFAQISHKGKAIYAALGHPVNHELLTSNKLSVPGWMIDNLGAEGMGEEVAVEWLSQEAFPEATRIVLRPQDSAFYHADAKEELERALTRLGILQQGTTIVVPLECLGGYQVAFDVVLTEPANLVLAHGDEVAMEFEEALDAIPAVEDEPPPLGDEPPPLGDESVVEEQPVGNTLGGTTRFMPNGEQWNPWKHGPWTG
jgi:hypothetical protein